MAGKSSLDCNYVFVFLFCFCFFVFFVFLFFILTDNEFRLKVDVINAAVLGGTVLTRRGCKYNTTTSESN